MAAFLYIEDIRGDATVADHQGEIELSSVTFPSNRPGIGVSGNLRMQEIAVTKPQDSASTALWTAATSGKIFSFMILDLVNNGSTARFTIKLVALASMNFQKGMESFNLNFETVSVEHL